MVARSCAYCGCPTATTSDHVFPRGLYGDKIISQAKLITVRACDSCNNDLAKDEALFRNVIAVSGKSNFAVKELWGGKIARAFEQIDRIKRAQELMSFMRPADELPGRYMIYPAEIPAVMRIVRKMARGLCHHHGLLTPVLDEQVRADIQRFEIPSEFLDEMTLCHVHPHVVQYRYALISEFGMHSAWFIEFFNRTLFTCVVYDSVAARYAAEAEATKVA